MIAFTGLWRGGGHAHVQPANPSIYSNLKTTFRWDRESPGAFANPEDAEAFAERFGGKRLPRGSWR
jgi:hypothetical protein